MILFWKLDRDIPTAFYWLRKSAGSGKDESIECLRRLEIGIASMCAACLKRLNGNGKKCTKCKSVYYCNKECQIKDWKEKHKMDCVCEIKE